MNDLPGITEQPYALDDKARKQVAAMLDLVSKKSRPCQKCGRKIWFVVMPSGKENPFTDDAVSHFADCPSAKDFKRKDNDR